MWFVSCVSEDRETESTTQITGVWVQQETNKKLEEEESITPDPDSAPQIKITD